MNLGERVGEVFAEEGVLARSTEHFRVRDGQTRMALAVARTIEQGGALVVEAGTGVGKTFSYLVPALLSGERVLVSTATKTLQDQLHGRDLPRLIETLGLPTRTALLKGRGSYLCLYRMEGARQLASGNERAIERTLSRIESWAQVTRSGDLAELPGLDERSPVIPLVTSTRENCLGSNCPRFKACHVNLARREALAADVVVINHHLFFADLAVRESGMAELLPTVRVAIFDEAHQLNETGVQFLGQQLATAAVLDFVRDLLAAGLQQARGLVDWQQVAGRVEHAARELRLIAGPAPAGGRLPWSGIAPEGIAAEQWLAALASLRAAAEQAAAALRTVEELGPDFTRLAERADQLALCSGIFEAACDPARVRWLDVGTQLRLVESPLDIADAVRDRLLGAGSRSAGDAPHQWAPEEPGRAWIFTSATLGADERLSWFTEPCGLTDAEVLRVDSPFDYAHQAALYVPRTIPRPNEAGHAQAVARIAARGAAPLGGRTLVLTTTLRALRAIGESLRVLLPTGCGVDVLVQGKWPKRLLMDRLRDGGRDGQAGCVLVASASFWEGVDIPGEALQLVVIDKLPFPPPGDPLVQARSQRLEAERRNPFADYHVPEAAVALKQGAGRLIRRESDTGVLVICDTRLISMGYGKRLLQALPPMRRVESEADYDAEITRISTRDRSWP